MPSAEWLRTFVAVFRSGSVTDGATIRHLTQSAASQQLRSLERSVGAPLFVRSSDGVEPTQHGRELYIRVADPLDHLEPLLTDIEGGTAPSVTPTIRFGSSPEYVTYGVLPRRMPDAEPLVVQFGSDADLLGGLRRGELDVAVTVTDPGRRALAGRALGITPFALVASPDHSPSVSGNVDQLGAELTGTPWVAYSSELPRTRRFWLTVLGRPFGGDLRLVAPDLRAVADAVARGFGISLLPEYACADGLATGTLVEVFPVADLVPAEAWFASARDADLLRPQVAEFVAGLTVPGVN